VHGLSTSYYFLPTPFPREVTKRRFHMPDGWLDQLCGDPNCSTVNEWRYVVRHGRGDGATRYGFRWLYADNHWRHLLSASISLSSTLEVYTTIVRYINPHSTLYYRTDDVVLKELFVKCYIQSCLLTFYIQQYCWFFNSKLFSVIFMLYIHLVGWRWDIPSFCTEEQVIRRRLQPPCYKVCFFVDFPSVFGYN